MIEPMRDILDSGLQTERAERDESWTRALRDELVEADVEMVPRIAQATVTLDKAYEPQGRRRARLQL